MKKSYAISHGFGESGESFLGFPYRAVLGSFSRRAMGVCWGAEKGWGIQGCFGRALSGAKSQRSHGELDGAGWGRGVRRWPHRQNETWTKPLSIGGEAALADGWAESALFVKMDEFRRWSVSVALGALLYGWPMRFCTGLTTALRCEGRVETCGTETSGIDAEANSGKWLCLGHHWH